MIIQWLLTLSLAWAAPAPEITASLSDQRVRPGDLVQLTISVKTEGEVDIETPQWPKAVGINNEGLQTQTSLESHLRPGPNGMEFEKKRSVDFIYSLRPMKAGNYRLGPFTVKVEGRDFNLGAVSLDVSPAAPPSNSGRRRGGGGFFPPGFEDEEDSLFGQLLRRQRLDEDQLPSKTLPINEKEAFFILLETDKSEAFEGEQVFASWYIYTRGNIHQFDRLKFPALRGFWKEDVEPAPSLNFEREKVNGLIYQRALLASYALFPIKPGTATIDEYKIRAVVSLPTSTLGGFSFGQPYTYTRSSKPLAITIKPLPLEGRPESFSGAIGNYNVQASVDHQTFSQGQPFTLRLKFEGDGNAKLIELPKIQWPEEFELYDVKSESRFFQSGKSFKEFSLLVIPKKAGVLKLPPFELSYFDPSTATYKTTQTQELALQVAPGTAMATDSSRLKLEKREDDGASLTLPPLIKEPRARSWRWLSGMGLFVVWSLLYALLFLGFILYNWFWWRRLNHQKNLLEELSDRRQKWEKTFKGSSRDLAATEVINAIYYLVSQLVDDSSFTRDLASLLDQLPPSIRGEVAEPLRNKLEVMQTVAFAPEGAWKNVSNESDFRHQAEQAFQILERMIRLSEEGTPMAVSER